MVLMKRLRLALPKGSLQEDTVELFRDASLDIQGDVDYAWIDDERIEETSFFRAQDIANIVEGGYFDLGITGLDWILDSKADALELSNLEYGKVRLVLYVRPETGINDPKEIRPNSIAASEYRQLPKDYFQELKIPIILMSTTGATEQIVKSGAADVGFDNMDSGKTIRSAGLETIGDPVLYSSARLISNKKSYDPNSEKIEYINDIKTLLEGARDARGKVILEMNVSEYALDDVLSLLPAMKAPTISELYNPNNEKWYSIKTIVSRNEAKGLIPGIKRAGAQDIIEYSLTKVIK